MSLSSLRSASESTHPGLPVPVLDVTRLCASALSLSICLSGVLPWCVRILSSTHLDSHFLSYQNPSPSTLHTPPVVGPYGFWHDFVLLCQWYHILYPLLHVTVYSHTRCTFPPHPPKGQVVMRTFGSGNSFDLMHGKSCSMGMVICSSVHVDTQIMTRLCLRLRCPAITSFKGLVINVVNDSTFWN